MSATYPLNLFSRSVIVGVSDHPQGADAIPELARTAYADMAAQTWTRDDSPPTMPVHEYNRPVPSGDAFAALWGYSAQGRTMQSAAGAVCYTFSVPADAVDQSTHGACLMESVSIGVCGDRYLDAGAIVAAVPSASPTPPTWAEIIAATLASDPVCATGDQLDAKGEPLPPNKREGESATVEFAPGSAPLRYLHIAVRLADYLATRGAWIEGGAMLVEGGVSATFSREVTPDSAPLRAGVSMPFNVSDSEFIVRSGSAGTYYTDLRQCPTASFRCSIVFGPDLAPPDAAWMTNEWRARYAFEAMSLPTEAFRSLERGLDPAGGAVYAMEAKSRMEFQQSTIPRFGFNFAAAADGGRVNAVAAYHAVESQIGNGRFSEVRFSSPIAPTHCAARVAVYFVSGRHGVASNDEQFLQPHVTMPIVPSPQTFLDGGALAGGATAVSAVTSAYLPHVSGSSAQQCWLEQLLPTAWIEGSTEQIYIAAAPTEISCTPVACREIPMGGSLSSIALDTPIEARGWGTLVVFVSPLPTSGVTSGTDSFNAATIFLS